MDQDLDRLLREAAPVVSASDPAVVEAVRDLAGHTQGVPRQGALSPLPGARVRRSSWPRWRQPAPGLPRRRRRSWTGSVASRRISSSRAPRPEGQTACRRSTWSRSPRPKTTPLWSSRATLWQHSTSPPSTSREPASSSSQPEPRRDKLDDSALIDGAVFRALLDSSTGKAWTHRRSPSKAPPTARPTTCESGPVTGGGAGIGRRRGGATQRA